MWFSFVMTCISQLFSVVTSILKSLPTQKVESGGDRKVDSKTCKGVGIYFQMTCAALVKGWAIQISDFYVLAPSFE